ncbi:MAG: PolC-type DNA polymerase III [Malacoplasma sp.]|nr:PolC-type DNA polymerase III [Malacoplasma sp.]
MDAKTKIFNFLNELNLVSQQEWNAFFNDSCDFKFVRQKANKKIQVKIIVKKILPPVILYNFVKKTSLVDESVSFNITYDYSQFEANLILDYLIFYLDLELQVKNIKGELKKLIQDVLENNKAQNLGIVEDKVIKIYYLSANQKSALQSFKPLWINFLKTFGFAGFDIDFIYDKKIENDLNSQKIEIQNKAQEFSKSQNENNKSANKDYSYSYKFKKSISGETIKLKDLFFEMKGAIVEGEIFKKEIITTKNGGEIHKFYITDYSDSLVIRLWFAKKVKNEVLSQMNIGVWIKAKISIQTDVYENNDITGVIEEVKICEQKPSWLTRVDSAKNKRVELINHTKMTAFEGLVNIKELFEFSNSQNYSAVSISDKFNCQNFPEFFSVSKKYPNLKTIYGVQLNLIDKQIKIVSNPTDILLSDATYVVFDIETTGLSPYYDKIIEFGAIKYYKGNIIDRIQFFINLEQEIDEKISSLTKITNNDLKDAILIKEALVKIKNFIGDAVLIAHNGIKFDLPFLNCKLEQEGMSLINNPLIDTLQISRAINEQIGGHSLGIIARKYKIDYNDFEAHRADKDAQYLLDVWKIMHNHLDANNIVNLNQINIELQNQMLRERNKGDLITVYCKKQEDVRNLYKLISTSLTDNYANGSKIYLQDLAQFKNNFLVTNSPTEGNVFDAALSCTSIELEQLIKNNYDFITIASPQCFLHEIHRNIYKREWIENAIKRIITVTKKYNKLVVASSDTYYLNKFDEAAFRIYVNAKTLGGKRNRIFRYNESNEVLPELHFRTTNELKEEFKFLKDLDLIEEIVVVNSNKIADLIDKDIKPIKENLHTPTIEGAEKNLSELINLRALKVFGKNINEDVKKRIERETKAVIDNGYAMVYWFSHLLVNQSIKDGYVVGSRGSVGSSIAAWLANISEVNPLMPHYLCHQCFYFKYVQNVASGFDLENIKCPNCNTVMKGNGHNIPFETFMGFEGDKIPDIDLNFSALYQTRAHDFIRNMFGKERVFRAGTINTIASKTAYGYVKTYFEENNIKNVRNAEILRLASKCEDVKRTTGQHPGGIVVIPTDCDIFDFTPFNYPADDTSLDWFTTHLAFESLHDSLLKFDILGHDNPTILKMLTQLTNVDPDSIPNNDIKVMQLFNSTTSLNIQNPTINKILKIGSSGIPEFGTNFVKEMLLIIKPQKFSDLIRISGLSHGTNVWNENAKNLIEKQNLKIADVISCRDDIMVYLISCGIDSKTAFKIMEDVRKGKGLKQEYYDVLIAKKIPQWYIDSCNKILYLFPKAHATAYVIMAWKIAWFKIYYPLAFYASYFSIRSDVFDINTILQGESSITQKIVDIKNRLANPKTKGTVKNKEIDLIPIYELALEMIGRGYQFSPIDLYKSNATDFIIENNCLIPPFSAIDGLGNAVANSIVEARNINPFKSKEDFKKRTKITTAHLKIMNELKITTFLEEDDQLSLFD